MKKLPSTIMILAFLIFSACNPSTDQPSSNGPGSTQVAIASTEQITTDQPTTETAPAPIVPSIEDAPLSVVDATSYFDRNGTLYVIGLVHNHGRQALANIQVAIQVADALGQPLAQATVPISTDPLFPGERTVFIQDFREITTAAPNITAEIVAFKMATSGRADLDIYHDSVMQTGESFIYLTGEIHNALPVPVFIEKVSAAFFDQDGNLLMANTWELGSHYLESGETGPFRITIDLSNLQIQPTDTYEIYYLADKSPLIQPVGLSFLGEPVYFVDSQGVFHLTAFVNNDSNGILHPYLLATIYDPHGRLIDVSQSNMFGLPLSPGETLPVDFSGWGVLNAAPPDLDENWSYALQWDPAFTQYSHSNWTTLEVQLDSQSHEGGIITIQGLLKNPGDRPVDSYTILAQFWDPADGSIMALISQTDEVTLPVGQSIPFTLNVKLPMGDGDLNPEVDLIAKGSPIE